MPHSKCATSATTPKTYFRPSTATHTFWASQICTPRLVPAGLTPCPASQAAIPELTGRVNCTGGALIRERANTGYSDYHGLQTEFRSSYFWNQLTLKSAYTFSKTTDNASEIGATLAAGGTFAISQSQVNFTDQEHSLSGIDFPQNWVFTALEDLPFYRHQLGFLGHALGGWRVSAVYSLHSGQPFTAAQSGLNCASGGGVCGGIADAENPYDPAFNAAFGGPDGSLRPFLGSSTAPVQSVGIFANDICAVDVAGNLCGSSTITPTTLISLNKFNNGFKGTMTDAAGNISPRSSPRRRRRPQKSGPLHREYADRRPDFRQPIRKRGPQHFA